MRSSGRSIGLMKCEAASRSSGISLCALRLASIISATSRGCLVSDSKMSIFCCTPSSKTWNASTGRSGAGRLCSSRTLTSTFTRLTCTLIVARGDAGSGLFSLACASLGFPCPLLLGCAHGGRSGFSCAASPYVEMSRTIPATSAWSQLLAWKIICLLGCRFCLWCRRGDFPVRPNGSILKILLFPDRNFALQRINGKLAGVERRRPVRRADGNKDACFADVQPSEAMHHGDPVNGKPFVDLRANLPHFRQRHGFVGFILQVSRGPAMRFVAHETIERDDGAILPRAYMPH